MVPWRDTVIYGAHGKGLTMRNPGVVKADRGTFAALASDPIIEHLQKIGVTTIELLPIHAMVQDRHLVENDLRNYWGYNTLGFFAPNRTYMATEDVSEVRAAVKRFHAAGIEVILDVVYNHTAEGNELGATLSFRGIDNASYYLLSPDNKHRSVEPIRDDRGCSCDFSTALPPPPTVPVAPRCLAAIDQPATRRPLTGFRHVRQEPRPARSVHGHRASAP